MDHRSNSSPNTITDASYYSAFEKYANAHRNDFKSFQEFKNKFQESANANPIIMQKFAQWENNLKYDRNKLKELFHVTANQ